MKIKKQTPLKRGAGILLPVSSLPSNYGIGTFGSEAYEFVDFLKNSKQKYWQILPLGPTSYGDSPYQSFSAFAGNPYFIDLDLLIEEGLLKKSQVQRIEWAYNEEEVDYAVLFNQRFNLLKAAYKKSFHKETIAFKNFCEENSFWLDEYSLYMSIKCSFENKEWLSWPDGLRLRDPSILKENKELLKNDTDFWKFCQFKFFEQWLRLKEYANKNGIIIIGDIPIYVAMDSSDVWANPQLFDLDEDRRPKNVSGVPPDMFSKTGQLWGNPLYNWVQMEKEDFNFWKARIKICARLYDVIRIDHFIGIVHYYSIPANENTAMNGVWQKGPGEKLINAINNAIGDKLIIAEDLGIVTKEVKALLKKSGYPGMKLLEMAFDNASNNENLPFFYEKNCVVYGGTHDNETLKGFFFHQKRDVLRYTKDYLNLKSKKEIPMAIIRTAYQSTANTVIFLVQDLLGLDNSARINIPSTIGQNWKWRLKKGQLTEELAEKLKKLTVIYGR